jgi:SAM-dependent methyltransferase
MAERMDDPDVVAREYASLDRLASRRLDRTGWLRGFEPVATMLAAVAEVHPQRVLDVGSGTGDLAALVAAPEVVCVDLSPAAVEAARSRGLDAQVADVQALPFADGEFDVVLGNWMLYHVPDLDRGLAEIARVLRPGGRFAGCYNRDGHLDELWSLVHPPFGRGEEYREPLERFFARVERRDTSGAVTWLEREDLQAYLDTYVELVGPLTAPAKPYPFVATRRNCVWVAER